ncbi:odorant receptor Or1 [Leptinotarsa decemlineata]|uniref:odorant receptor Or1 n=1 Tax=Leptinotarsa decemlineata TaxID=7539 RepID=UPI003D307264
MPSHSIIEGSLRYNLLIMKTVGIYPYNDWPKIFKIYANFFYLIFTIPTPILILVNFILMEEKTLERICDSAFLGAQLGTLLVKLWPFKSNPEAIKRTVKALNQEIFNSYRQDQECIVKSAIKEYNFIFLGVISASGVSFVTWFGKIFFYEEKRFPLEIWLPFDAFEDTRIYVGVLVYLFFCVLIGALDNASLDTLIVGMIFQSATQVKILKNDLQFLHERIEQKVNDNFDSKGVKENRIYKSICKSIDHYDAIFQYAKDIERVYSTVIFSQLFVSIVVICISCLQLSIVEPFTILFFGMVIYIMTMLMQVFLYCYYGTMLYEESNTLTTAIYESEWYNYDHRSKKCLLTLMERAKRPIKQTAGKFFDLSLETFTMILRRSYSLLAVLQNY